MINKKDIKTVGIIAGAVAAVAGLTVGAIAIFRRIKAKKLKKAACQECEPAVSEEELAGQSEQ